MPAAPTLAVALRALFLDRQRLVLENLALRQQLNVLRRSVKRPQIARRDKVFWLLLRLLLSGWEQCLMIVRPETVLRWHRAGWRAIWRHKCRHKIGRPEIPRKLYCLIRKLSRENPLWGAHRIADELALLGWKVGKSTVGRYMHRKRPNGTQPWKTFLRNSMNVTAACDFFTVPTVTFRKLFALVILSHDRRLIRHVAVTAHPTSAWIGEQLREAFPEPGARPEYLIHDREKNFRSPVFTRVVEELGIEDRYGAPRQPWMNGYCERVIGTLRRDCTDHVLVFNEAHLQRLLQEYVAYYNGTRTHMSLDGNAPIPRVVEPTPAAELRATPVLGGLHHTYTVAA